MNDQVQPRDLPTWWIVALVVAVLVVVTMMFGGGSHPSDDPCETAWSNSTAAYRASIGHTTHDSYISWCRQDTNSFVKDLPQ